MFLTIRHTVMCFPQPFVTGLTVVGIQIILEKTWSSSSHLVVVPRRVFGFTVRFFIVYVHKKYSPTILMSSITLLSNFSL